MWNPHRIFLVVSEGDVDFEVILLGFCLFPFVLRKHLLCLNSRERRKTSSASSGREKDSFNADLLTPFGIPRRREDTLYWEFSKEAPTSSSSPPRTFKNMDTRKPVEDLFSKLHPSLPLNTRIGIIGGGPSGLSAAYALSKLGYSDVTVLEKYHSVSGMCESIEIEGKE